MNIAKRIAITLALLVAPLALGLLITYEVIKIDWISMMEIQSSFRPMEEPLPLPARSVPVDGVAYIADVGSPQNPVAADALSLERGAYFYSVYCALCHGAQGAGDGPLAEKLRRKPANLTGANVSGEDDGTLFLTLTNGVPGTMPSFKESLDLRDRWDVVNYVRSLQP